MKILVIGSEGFIGSHLIEYFSKEHTVAGAAHEAVASRTYRFFNLTVSQPDWAGIFQADQFDFCINAAGSANVPYSMTHPLYDFEHNVLHTIQLLEAIRLYQPACKYLHISSAAVYGSPQSLPIKETHHVQPLSPYGWHKYSAENICREYHFIHKVNTAITRPFSVFGPRLRKQLFWDLYLKHKTGKSAIDLWGTGRESRDFIYISDLCYSFELIMQQSPFDADVYNIASGVETTVEEAATALYSELGGDVLLNFNQHVREGDPINWRADISAIQHFGFTPKVTFPEGIKKLSQWLKSLN